MDLSKEIVGCCFSPYLSPSNSEGIGIKFVWNCGAAEGELSVHGAGQRCERCSIECECPLLHSLVSSWAGPRRKSNKKSSSLLMQ